MEEEEVCATQEPAEEEEEGEEYFAATQEPAAEDTLQPELPRLVLRQLGCRIGSCRRPSSRLCRDDRSATDRGYHPCR